HAARGVVRGLNGPPAGRGGLGWHVHHPPPPSPPAEIEHRYGPKVHLLGDPLSLTMLARACQKGVVQPEVNRLIGELYRILVHDVVAAEFPRRRVEVPTRMIDVVPEGVWAGEVIDPVAA